MHRPITFRTQLTMNGITLALMALLLLVSNTFATPSTTGVPTTTTINYQGHLTNPDGTPVNGTLPMTFMLYRASTGGTAIWTEQRSGSNSVPVSNGLFSVALGSVTPINISLFGEPLWLGISVNGEAEMTPREAFAGVPYAAVAGTVPDGSISSSKLNLDSGNVCLADDIQMNVSGKGLVTVPNLSLSFLLNQPALVIISMEGIADVVPTASNSVGYQMSLLLDNEIEAVISTWGGDWFDVNAQRIMRLNAGTHTLSAQAAGAGTLKLYGPSNIYRDRLCLNYVVLGEQ